MISVYRPTLLAALLAAACRAGPPTPGAAPAPALPTPGAAPSDTICRIAPGPAAKRDTVAVALAEPIDPTHAPQPRNDAERFVFAQLYETLIRVDCAGRVLPGLAQSWEASGDRWTFTLRDDARFWDGAPVTARDVVAAWRARDSALAQSATILSDRTIAVRPPVAPVQPLADPALAVTKRAPGGNWPIGTGGHWVSETDATGALTAVPVRRGALAVLRVSSVPAGRARDALDEGSDLVITDDPAVLEYAGTRPGYVDVALDWNRTYVLLAPAAFAVALRAGGDAAYVLPLRRRVFDVCRAALDLPPWSWTATVQPLLDVRPHALVRRGLPPLQVDWDGTLRIAPR